VKDIGDVYASAKVFASDDVGKAYLILRLANDWQKETGGTLDELLAYIEQTCTKKEIAP
jgi:hypothetical protein